VGVSIKIRFREKLGHDKMVCVTAVDPLIYLWNANSNNLQQTCKYECGLLAADLTAGAPRPGLLLCCPGYHATGRQDAV